MKGSNLMKNWILIIVSATAVCTFAFFGSSDKEGDGGFLGGITKSLSGASDKIDETAGSITNSTDGMMAEVDQQMESVLTQADQFTAQITNTVDSLTTSGSRLMDSVDSSLALIDTYSTLVGSDKLNPYYENYEHTLKDQMVHLKEVESKLDALQQRLDSSILKVEQMQETAEEE